MKRLDPAAWHVISPLFDQALDLDAEARRVFLDDLRASDAPTAETLTRLLTSHERLLGSAFLDTPALADIEPDLAGSTIGAYTLDAPLGAGGMGVVWKAHRSDGRYEGAVALKLLQLAVLERHAEATFTLEGSLLARLSHPNIARLLDAGVTEAGQPYLVLEYVAGTRLDAYAEAVRLDVPARLALLLQVCDAVAHAHTHLVLHRDLKPSNVLVDGEGRVKLLDFGVGSWLDHESAHGAPGGPRRFTPGYAAPEQRHGGAITTATDVYALGVLLQGLLTARDPVGGALPGRRRRGDLEAIVAKALKDDPAERYEGVSALAEDVRRHLRHETIAARPATVAYRTATFLRRHRWPVAVSVVIVALLSAGLYVTDRQRRISDSRFQQLRRLSGQVFSLDARLNYVPGTTQAREVLVAASLQYLEGLSAAARSDLDLAYEVADGYLSMARIQGVPTGPTLGHFDQAEASLQKAEALVETLLAARPDDLRALVLSAEIRHDRMIVADSVRRVADAIGHATGAAARIEEVLGDARATPEQRQSALARYSNIALGNVNLRRYDEAVRLARRHLELIRPAGADPIALSASLSVLANALRLQGDLDGALAAIRESRGHADRVAAAGPVPRLNRYGPLLREGFILGEDRSVSLDRPTEAMVPLREAFEMVEEAARSDPGDYTSRSRVGTVGRELGDILRWRDPREALAIYGVALGRLGEVENNVRARRDSALILAGSAYALRRLDRVAEARARIDQAVAILTETKDHPAKTLAFDDPAFSVLLARADQLADEGQPRPAIADYVALLALVSRNKADADHDLRDANSLALLCEGLAQLHRASGDPGPAIALDARRLALWQHWDRTLPNNAFVRRKLASLMG